MYAHLENMMKFDSVVIRLNFIICIYVIQKSRYVHIKNCFPDLKQYFHWNAHQKYSYACQINFIVYVLWHILVHRSKCALMTRDFQSSVYFIFREICLGTYDTLQQFMLISCNCREFDLKSGVLNVTTNNEMCLRVISWGNINSNQNCD